MHEREVERETAKKSILKRLGYGQHFDRVTESEVTFQQMEAWIESLPLDPRFQFPLQAPDGTFYMVYGSTPYGSSIYAGPGPGP